MIYAEIMQTCVLYIEIIHNITGRKNISVIFRDLVYWVKKQAIKEVLSKAAIHKCFKEFT